MRRRGNVAAAGAHDEQIAVTHLSRGAGLSEEQLAALASTVVHDERGLARRQAVVGVEQTAVPRCRAPVVCRTPVPWALMWQTRPSPG